MPEKIDYPKKTWYKKNDNTVNLKKVNKNLIKLVNLIGDHYKTKIIITSGYRDDAAQVLAMYNNWPNVKDLYARINKNKETKEKLSDFHKKKDFANFKKHMKESVGIPKSNHGFGTAIDVKKSTKPKILSALRSLLKELPENHCYHFQINGSLTDSKILAAKKKWK